MQERRPPRPEHAPKSNLRQPQPETVANPFNQPSIEPSVPSADFTPSQSPAIAPRLGDFARTGERGPPPPISGQERIVFADSSAVRPDFDRWPGRGYPPIGGGSSDEPSEEKEPDTIRVHYERWFRKKYPRHTEEEFKRLVEAHFKKDELFYTHFYEALDRDQELRELAPELQLELRIKSLEELLNYKLHDPTLDEWMKGRYANLYEERIKVRKRELARLRRKKKR